MKFQGLGRGLSDLFAEHESDLASLANSRPSEKHADYPSIDIGLIRPRLDQPRKIFDEGYLLELSESIKQYGIVQPLILRATEDGQYEVIAGERRLRAARIANLSYVPARVVQMDDETISFVSIIENLQRVDLSPIEEAESYKILVESGLTHDDIAKKVSKSRSHITNLLRLCGLPLEIKQMINDKKLTVGHAKVLLGLEDPILIARKVVEDDLSVREIERLLKKITKIGVSNPKRFSKSKNPDDDLKLIADLFENSLGIEVEIEGTWLKMNFQDLEGLDKLVDKIVN